MNILEKLDRLILLPPGWDGYVGRPVKQKSVDKAKEYLKILPTGEWQAIPGCDGSVQLELHTMDCDIEIYINTFEVDQ